MENGRKNEEKRRGKRKTGGFSHKKEGLQRGASRGRRHGKEHTQNGSRAYIIIILFYLFYNQSPHAAFSVRNGTTFKESVRIGELLANTLNIFRTFAKKTRHKLAFSPSEGYYHKTM